MTLPTITQFTAAQGDAFRLEQEGVATVLTLTQVRATGPAFADGAREPFTLRFRSDAATALPQGIYPLAHPDLGTLEIFIVPIAVEDGAAVYEAVFN